MSRRRHEDAVVKDILGNYRRAGATLVIAAVVFLGWLVFLVWTHVGGMPVPFSSVPSVLATYLGWASLVLGIIAAMQYGHAYTHLRSQERQDQN